MSSSNEEAITYDYGDWEPVIGLEVHAQLKTATKLFILEALYARRGYSKDTEPKNPWYSQSAAMRARLQRVSSGDERVSPTQAQVVPGVVLVSEPSRTQSSSNKVGF